jgi:uncharacterized membrane protein YsdA (DUF1294 family)
VVDIFRAADNARAGRDAGRSHLVVPGRRPACDTSAVASEGGVRLGLGQAALISASFLGGLLVLALVDEDVPMAAFWVYAALSGVSFAAYGLDKVAAKRGSGRIRERNLHVADALGGWPGGLVARHLFRHKTVKQPFRTVFWVTVAANCALLAATVTALR